MLAKLLKSELVTTCPQVRVLGRSDASVLASAREHSEHRRHPTLLASANIFTEVIDRSHRLDMSARLEILSATNELGVSG